MRANGPELSGPAEAGTRSPTLRHTGGQSKPHLRPSSPGQSKILVFFQGFSELLGGGMTGGVSSKNGLSKSQVARG